MKIGIDARLWNQTGVGRYIRNLIYSLEKIDSKNDYFVFARKQDNVKLKSKNFSIVESNISWHSVEEQLKFPKILNKHNLDVVHFPYYSVPFSYRKNFVVTIHDLIPLHFQTGEASTLFYPLYRLKLAAFKFVVSKAAKNSKKIIAPSNFSKDEIVKFLNVPSSKIKVIYEGTDEFLNNGRIQKKEHFLYVGNAYPHKNLELLTEVFKETPSIKLILVGKEDHFYKRLKDKNKKVRNIKFFGYATDSQLRDLYGKAKALIIPSFIEGFGLPALEAMANNCLILASDIPVLREVCSNSAIYFDPKDRENLKKLIIKITSNSAQYRSKIDFGLKRVKDFNWQKTAEETLKIYESCASINSV